MCVCVCVCVCMAGNRRIRSQSANQFQAKCESLPPNNSQAQFFDAQRHVAPTKISFRRLS